MIVNSRRQRRTAGFTLVEIMVALSVVAIALAAIIRVNGDNARTVVHLRDKTFASWVAENVLAELELTDPWPDTGTREDETEFAARVWPYRITVSEAPDPDLRRIEIAVLRPDQELGGTEYTAGTLVGFVARPAGVASDEDDDGNAPNPGIRPGARSDG